MPIFPVWKWYGCIPFAIKSRKCHGIFWDWLYVQESSWELYLVFFWRVNLIPWACTLEDLYLRAQQLLIHIFRGTHDKKWLGCEYNKMPSISLYSAFIDEYLKWHSQYCIADSITSIDYDSFWYLSVILSNDDERTKEVFQWIIQYWKVWKVIWGWLVCSTNMTVWMAFIV